MQPAIAQHNLLRNSPLVQCLHVCKRSALGKDRLRDVTLEVHKGEFLLLVGPGGSGKSTLLRLLLGLEPLSGGHILIAGRNLHGMGSSELSCFRRLVGVIPQDLKLLMQRSVYENVALPLEVAGRQRSFVQKKVLQVLRLVGLDHRAGVLCGELSGSERQRVAIARAVVNDPVLLLADEPFTHLDAHASARMMDLFRSLCAQGSALILTTHAAPSAVPIPESRLVLFENGRSAEANLVPGHVSYRRLRGVAGGVPPL